jgi:pimeloyl-ACP methyl ester carboxylesterase
LEEVVFVGMSAGSYMACRAAETIQESGMRVSALVLQSPAAYPLSAEFKTYGRDFTDTLSNEWDISSSPVFDAIRKAASNDTKVMVSFFEKDDPPIPTAIQDTYAQTIDELSSQGHIARLHTIDGVEHNFRRIGSDHSGNIVNNDSVRETARAIKDFIHAS